GPARHIRLFREPGIGSTQGTGAAIQVNSRRSSPYGRYFRINDAKRDEVKPIPHWKYIPTHGPATGSSPSGQPCLDPRSFLIRRFLPAQGRPVRIPPFYHDV